MPVIFDRSGLDNAMKDIDNLFSTDTAYELANECVNDFMDNFNRQSFDNLPWEQSTKEQGATLILSGQLRNSIRTLSASDNEFSIISDMDYSEIHNEGGTIMITDKMRKYFWAMYSTTKNEMWKGLALTKKSFLTIPKRQFMGESDSLTNRIIDMSLKKLQ